MEISDRCLQLAHDGPKPAQLGGEFIAAGLALLIEQRADFLATSFKHRAALRRVFRSNVVISSPLRSRVASASPFDAFKTNRSHLARCGLARATV